MRQTVRRNIELAFGDLQDCTLQRDWVEMGNPDADFDALMALRPEIDANGWDTGQPVLSGQWTRSSAQTDSPSLISLVAKRRIAVYLLLRRRLTCCFLTGSQPP